MPEAIRSCQKGSKPPPSRRTATEGFGNIALERRLICKRTRKVYKGRSAVLKNYANLQREKEVEELNVGFLEIRKKNLWRQNLLLRYSSI